MNPETTSESNGVYQNIAAASLINFPLIPLNAHVLRIANPKSAALYGCTRTVMRTITVPIGISAGASLGSFPGQALLGLYWALGEDTQKCEQIMNNGTISGIGFGCYVGLASAAFAGMKTTAKFAPPLTSRQIFILEGISAIQTASACTAYQTIGKEFPGWNNPDNGYRKIKK